MSKENCFPPSWHDLGVEVDKQRKKLDKIGKLLEEIKSSETITNRPPNATDADKFGHVLYLTEQGWRVLRWNCFAKDVPPWSHTPSWKPRRDLRSMIAMVVENDPNETDILDAFAEWLDCYTTACEEGDYWVKDVALAVRKYAR